MFAAPGTFTSLIERGSGDHRIIPPALQGSSANPNLPCNNFQRGAACGSKRATALSLNFCPYRAIHVFHRRPQVLGSIGTTTILTRGEIQSQIL